ncbi:MAG: hypothetical protein ACMXX7_00475 [Candidatus Woesearchaeota archaeon]
MKRGRPTGSIVRQTIVNILFQLGKAHGYHIYKVYKEIDPKISIRLVYYHLKKGVETEEFKLSKIIKEQGDYSWGSQAEKHYYQLGPESNPRTDTKIKNLLETRKDLR